MAKLKLVTLSIVVDEANAETVAREMEKSHIAQEGIYTLACGDIEDLPQEDVDMIYDELPLWLQEELDEED